MAYLFSVIAKSVYQHPEESNFNDLFWALGLQKLCHLRLEKKAIIMFKTLNGMIPEYLT